MPLSAGDKLGPDEILAPIGAGGMGVVYRARIAVDRRGDFAVRRSDTALHSIARGAAAPDGRHRQQEQAPAVREEFIAMTYVKVCVRNGWHMTVPRVIHEAVRVDRT